MEEEDDSDIDVKEDIKAELIAINEILKTIKQELLDINEYVKKDGPLDATQSPSILNAQSNAIQSLSSLATSVGITVVEPIHDEDNPAANPLAAVSMQYITEMLESLSHR